MNDKILYGFLEIIYANKNNIEKDDNYDENINKILPKDWYSLSAETRCDILDEAIANNILVKDCEKYKNLYPKDAII